MQRELKISVFEVAGTPLCVASSDGERVYERLALALKKNRNVALSFNNVHILTAAFLNAAIGQLYGVFQEDKIRTSVEVQEMQPEDLALLKRVVDNAKEYFKDPQRFERALHDALEERSEN